jgi:hypothetical protein
MTTSEPDPRTDLAGWLGLTETQANICRRDARSGYADIRGILGARLVAQDQADTPDPEPDDGLIPVTDPEPVEGPPGTVPVTLWLTAQEVSGEGEGWDSAVDKLCDACAAIDLPAPKPPWKSPPDDRPDLTEQQCRYAYDAGIDPDRHDPWAQIGRAPIAAGWDPEGGSVSDYWDDDDETWHCGTCGNAPCECGDDIVMVVKVPGIRAADADADLVAMALMAMCNEQRADNGGADRPIRLLTASFVEEADRG